jgi:hypothetical protein
MISKKYILQEIKRTTELNGGKPLGRKRFETETGIKESDWSGKFWVKWNDILRDAGYIPNQLTRPHDIEALLNNYAGFAQELGHLPVKAELQLKRRSDPTFPSHNVFCRFGTKSQLVKILLEYCQSHEGYNEVILMCKEYVPENEKTAELTTRQVESFGFVYLLKSGRFYKIGRSNDAGRREYEIALQLPEKVKKIHVIRTDDPVGIEEYWHKRFAVKRKNGEWFELNAADVAAFKRRKFM